MPVSPREQPQGSTRLRWLFVALVALLVWIVAEAVAWAGFWYLDGRPFSYKRLREERAALVPVDGKAANEYERRRPHFVLHPYVGYVGNPRRPLAAGEYEHNEYGFADPNPPLHRRGPGRTIIGIAGGSMARRFGELGAPILAEVLSGSPAFAGREIHFVRTGASGYKQPQQLMALNYLMSLGGEFDIVLALDGFNEIALPEVENLNFGMFPAFPRKWNFRAARAPTPEMRIRLGDIARARAERRRWAHQVSVSLLEYSPVANLLWRSWDRRLEGWIHEAREWIDEHQGSTNRYSLTGPERSYASREEMYADFAAIWARSSQQLHILFEGMGTHYLQLLQPNQYLRGSKRLTKEERELAYDPENAYYRGVVEGYPHLLRAGQELLRRGVDFHDLTRIFSDVEETLYIDSCCHVNARGHEILARAIAEAILDPARRRSGSGAVQGSSEPAAPSRWQAHAGG